MNKRPWQLYVLSISFLFLTAAPFLRALRVDSSGNLQASSDFFVMNYEFSTFLLAGFCGLIFVSNASKKILIFLPAFLLLAWWEVSAAFENAQNGSSISLSFWGASIFILSQSMWMFGKARRALLDPNSRWWRTPRRVLASAPAHIRTNQGENFSSKIVNVSKDGLLLDLPSGGGSFANFRQGQLLDLRFLLGPLKVVRCRAEVVRRVDAESSERYGLRVIHMQSDSKKKLRNYLDSNMAA